MVASPICGRSLHQRTDLCVELHKDCFSKDRHNLKQLFKTRFYMKKLVFLLLTIAAVQTSGNAQCNADLYSEKSLKNISPGYMYEKSYRVDGRGGRRQKVEYSCILSKDINYSFTMNSKDGGSQGLIFSLFDARRNMVATNYINDKFFEGIQYKCNSTGIYHLSFTFKDSRSFCGAAVLAFRR